MIASGMRIFPTSCRRGQLGVLLGARVEAELGRHADDELDHVAAVAARVGVVRLDDVAEEEGGAAVGVAELERVVDAAVPLAREEGEEAEEREYEQDGERLVVGHDREEEAGRRERRVHEVDGAVSRSCARAETSNA